MITNYNTSIDSEIDALYEKYRQKFMLLYSPDEARDLCLAGKISLLNIIHRTSFDESTVVTCFRSEDVSKIDNVFSQDNKMWDLTIKSNSIEENLQDTFRHVRDAVNNSKDSEYEVRSYSKFLGTSLFKYGNDRNALIMKDLNLDTLDIQFLLSCRNWIGEGDISYDQFGNEVDRYYTEDIDVTIPIIKLTSKKSIRDILEEYLYYRVEGQSDISYEYSIMRDVENVELLDIVGFTIDASKLSRQNISSILPYEKTFGMRKGYKIDSEVISTDSLYKATIVKNNKLIQLLRILFLLRLCKDNNSYNRLLDKYNSNYFHNITQESQDEHNNILKILEYLDRNIENERDNYTRVFGTESNDKLVYPYFYIPYYKLDKTENIHDLIDKIHAETILLADDELFNKAKQIYKQDI